ncbi:hypothetical protein [Pararhizobium antarcticum]|uniref:hypothetical protein n=1 Tax=Pararhizobium antarcticum TaxID=1798805 RepID=UPI00111500A6|nr:hypothetical protein [Pararhizobium antarcticum]
MGLAMNFSDVRHDFNSFVSCQAMTNSRRIPQGVREMTDDPAERRRLPSRVVLEAFAAWRRARRLRCLFAEIGRRGDDHLLDDIGAGQAAFGESQERLRDVKRARHFFWML